MTDDMKPGVAAVDHRDCPGDPATCNQTAGHRCITPSGKETNPHVSRWKRGIDFADGYNSRRPEVDDLKVALQSASAEVTGLTEQVAALTRDLAVTKAELAAALAQIPAPAPVPDPVPAPVPVPTPVPPKSRTLPFGIGIDVIGDLETHAGKPVAYHRTYWSLPSSGVHTSAVASAKADLAAGRTPIVSFKLPSHGDFTGAVDGKYDACVKATVDALAALGGVVIVVIEHEPEKYGDAALPEYLAATAHLVPVVKRPTVQFWQGFMGYHQLFGSSAWKLAKVYVAGVDGMGFDPYLSYGASSTKWTDQTTAYYKPFGDFAKAHGIQWGIFETGMNEQAASSGLPQASSFVADCAAGAKAHGAGPWCWFGSQTNKDGKHDWRLSTTGANKAAQMAAAVAAYARP